MVSDLILPVAGGLLGSMYLDSRFLVSRDLQHVRVGTQAGIVTGARALRDRLHFYYRFKDLAKSAPHRLFVLFEGKPYTLGYMEKASNQLAHWLLAQNVKPKDVVSMMHQNHPTFFILLFAISKIGAIPSLINTNLANESLLHCIKISKAKLFLFDPVYEQQVATVRDQLMSHISFFAYGEATETTELDFTACPALTPRALKAYSTLDTEEKYLKGIGKNDAAFLIYTSGTTGLPKAAVFQHLRVSFGMIFTLICGIKKEDRVYCVLPLYHSSGLVITCLSSLQAGATIVLGRKFSARRFWNDCVDYKITVFTYIGEICRYLQSQPPHPEERNHQIRLILGNGLRPDVWNRFRDRFAIPKICEFYSSTEAPTAMTNFNTSEFGAGAVGFRGYLCRLLRPDVRLIKIDPITEEPARPKKNNGLCLECKFGEQGELVIPVFLFGSLGFDGYYGNKEASNRNILRNVFKKGDVYFRSGDLMRMDSDGFLYFDDRVGDTFRWKSENVATTEVAQVLGLYPGVADANVYGALVPHHDGRVGMAAIALEEGKRLDFKDLYGYLCQQLPKYAVPVFIRIVPAMELTGTFKLQKGNYRNQGIDLNKMPVEQPMYWICGDTYVPFTLDDLRSIQDGVAKL